MPKMSNWEAREELEGKEFKVLDYGHVVLMDVMGDDAAIAQAARTSYKKGTKTVNDDRGLLRNLMRNRHCYVGSMQVLTSEGWKRWDELGEDAIFLVPDPLSRTMTPERLAVKKFLSPSTVYSYTNDRMSFRVTERHKMRFRKKDCENFDAYQVEEMPQWGHFDPLQDYKMLGAERRLDTMMQFIGFFLGDGSWASQNRITFNLKKAHKQEYLCLLAQRLGLKEELRATENDSVVFSFATPRWLFGWLRFGEKASEKSFDMSRILMLSDSQVLGLFDGLCKSDGHDKYDREQISFSSTSVALLDLFECLAAIQGIDAHRTTNDRSTAFLGSRTTLEARKQYFSEPVKNYQDMTYCATTSTGWLMVRGNPTEFAFVCGNSTPFEMAELKFHIKLPIFCERQMIRHRTASTNEVSARYSELPEEYYLPQPEDVAAQSKTNKQGREEQLSDSVARIFISGVKDSCADSFNVYHDSLVRGVARELARINLPVGTYTEKVWKVDLHNLFHFLGLRMDKHAQWEVRQYANVIGEIVKKLFPICWEAFEDFRLNAAFLSALDIRQIQELAKAPLPIFPCDFFAYAIPEWRDAAVKNTERAEFMIKATRLGMIKELHKMPVASPSYR